jgi:hypothetical protein
LVWFEIRCPILILYKFIPKFQNRQADKFPATWIAWSMAIYGIANHLTDDWQCGGFFMREQGNVATGPA